MWLRPLNFPLQIHKVYDQFLNFVCIENEMFILRHQNSTALSYHALHQASVNEEQMEDMLNQVSSNVVAFPQPLKVQFYSSYFLQIVDSLFAVCVTLGTIPIIRCPKGNAAEAIAKKLDRKLRDNLRDARNSLFVNDGIQVHIWWSSHHRCIVTSVIADYATTSSPKRV